MESIEFDEDIQVEHEEDAAGAGAKVQAEAEAEHGIAEAEGGAEAEQPSSTPPALPLRDRGDAAPQSPEPVARLPESASQSNLEYTEDFDAIPSGQLSELQAGEMPQMPPPALPPPLLSPQVGFTPTET